MHRAVRATGRLYLNPKFCLGYYKWDQVANVYRAWDHKMMDRLLEGLQTGGAKLKNAFAIHDELVFDVDLSDFKIEHVSFSVGENEVKELTERLAQLDVQLQEPMKAVRDRIMHMCQLLLEGGVTPNGKPNSKSTRAPDNNHVV
jgi:uncharacterized Zn finger protein